MSVRFSQDFKEQAVKKVLNRSGYTTKKELAEQIGVDPGTLRHWLKEANNSPLSEQENMSKEKRPQDWSLEERLNMVISCAPLDEQAMNERCREQGIYPHHVNQWKKEFANGTASSQTSSKSPENKRLKNEVKSLKKELSRKEKALAETAALLVLKKKADAIWGVSEEDSQ